MNDTFTPAPAAGVTPPSPPPPAPAPAVTAAAPPTIDALLAKATVDPKDPGYVHYGNLRVEASLQKDFEQAERYLAKSPEALKTLESLQNDPHTTTIKGITDQNDLYRPSTRTIEWDPKSAMVTTNGGVQSAALGLEHEQEHARGFNEDPAAYRTRVGTRDAGYQNLEEKRVIAGPETTIAKELGEGTRTDHGGRPFHTTNSIDLTPPPSPRHASIDPSEAKTSIESALVQARATGQAAGPEPASVTAWDGKAHTGSIVHIDANTVAVSIGRGEYQTLDVQNDLHGVIPPANDPNVAISPQGHVQTPQAQALAQSH